jgi:hypothetical protein
MQQPEPERPTELAIHCYFCDEISIADIAGQLNISDVEMGYPRPTVISLVRCKRCTDIMLFQQEDGGYPIRQFTWSPPRRLWPWEEGMLNDAIPEPLRAEHRQARACFKAKAYTAAVVMVRRTLEGVCEDHAIQEKTLARSLEEMAQRKLLDGQLVEWARELRVLGNVGAHYTGKTVEARDASDAIDLAEALLDYVYVFSRRFRAFRDRRQNET